MFEDLLSVFANSSIKDAQELHSGHLPKYPAVS
jgi:hypothetical protein